MYACVWSMFLHCSPQYTRIPPGQAVKWAFDWSADWPGWCRGRMSVASRNLCQTQRQDGCPTGYGYHRAQCAVAAVWLAIANPRTMLLPACLRKRVETPVLTISFVKLFHGLGPGGHLILACFCLMRTHLDGTVSWLDHISITPFVPWSSNHISAFIWMHFGGCSHSCTVLSCKLSVPQALSCARPD